MSELAYGQVPVRVNDFSQAARNQTIIDTEGMCNWSNIVRKVFIKWHIPLEDLRDRTMELLDGQNGLIARKLRMNFNAYIGVTASELGAGKSDTSLDISWLLDPNFSLENCFANNLSDVAQLVRNRKRDFTIAWDEAQDEVGSVDWAQLPLSTRKFITSQRANKINIVWATPSLKRMWYVIRDNLTYDLHIIYRCNQHVHGYLYERSGSPMDTNEFIITGTFTIPKPTDKYLLSEIERYHTSFKQDYMDESQAEFLVDQLEGGQSRALAIEFAKWYYAKNITTKSGSLKAPTKGYVTVWASDTRQAFTDTVRDEISAFAKSWWESGEIEEMAKEWKAGSKKK